ncbi:MAG: thioredoxin family protein [Saprospiraceae bacterium]|nr:thioredoxin family protein [Saprospiraceae bacterium]
MSLTESNMLPLGTSAPSFNLPDSTTNELVNYLSVRGEKATVVMFLCNHCPFVIHVNEEIVAVANQYLKKGVGFVAISSNDVINYPQDAPDKMAIVAKVLRYPFPYLFDESQDIAKNYDAACTPDFYIFDAADKLVYRGRLDGSRPGNDIPLSGSDLRNALDAVLLGITEISPQIPSAGCNIKWKS